MTRDLTVDLEPEEPEDGSYVVVDHGDTVLIRDDDHGNDDPEERWFEVGRHHSCTWGQLVDRCRRAESSIIFLEAVDVWRPR